MLSLAALLILDPQNNNSSPSENIFSNLLVVMSVLEALVDETLLPDCAWHKICDTVAKILVPKVKARMDGVQTRQVT
jgi:hypothetical protein